MKIFGSLNGGALYANKYMLVNSNGDDGSWSYVNRNKGDLTSEQFVLIIENHAFKSVEALISSNEYLNKKYRVEFEEVIFNRYFRLSWVCLRYRVLEKFKKYIIERLRNQV